MIMRWEVEEAAGADDRLRVEMSANRRAGAVDERRYAAGEVCVAKAGVAAASGLVREVW